MPIRFKTIAMTAAAVLVIAVPVQAQDAPADAPRTIPVGAKRLAPGRGASEAEARTTRGRPVRAPRGAGPGCTGQATSLRESESDIGHDREGRVAAPLAHQGSAVWTQDRTAEAISRYTSAVDFPVRFSTSKP